MASRFATNATSAKIDELEEVHLARRGCHALDLERRQSDLILVGWD
jgi:hypothetical protein